MLSTLRPGTPIYLFFKNEMRFAAGTVHQISGQYPNMGYQQQVSPGANIAVDIAVNIDGKIETYQRIPLNTTIAEYPEKGVVISETKEGIINEVTAYRNSRQAILQQVPTIEKEIASCDNLLLEISPELKREQEQAAEIAMLKKEMSDMSGRFDAVNDQLATITGLLSKTLGKKKEE